MKRVVEFYAGRFEVSFISQCYANFTACMAAILQDRCRQKHHPPPCLHFDSNVDSDSDMDLSLLAISWEQELKLVSCWYLSATDHVPSICVYRQRAVSRRGLNGRYERCCN